MAICRFVAIHSDMWQYVCSLCHCDVVVSTTAQLQATNSGLRLYSGSNHTRVRFKSCWESPKMPLAGDKISNCTKINLISQHVRILRFRRRGRSQSSRCCVSMTWGKLHNGSVGLLKLYSSFLLILGHLKLNLNNGHVL